MEEILVELSKITAELSDIKNKFALYEAEKNFDNWIPRKRLMDFFGYEDTQMAELLRSEELRVAQIGNRKFIQRDSVIKLLEKNVKK